MLSPPADVPSPDLLLKINNGFSVSKQVVVASVCVLLYDFLICLSQEIEFFWLEAEWTLTRVLYFLNRTIPAITFAFHLYLLLEGGSHDFCLKAATATTSLEIIGMVTAEAILVIRVYYLWSHRRSVQYWLIISFICSASISIVFCANAVRNFKVFRLPAPYPQGCVYTGGSLFWPIFVPNILLQTLLFVLTTVRIMKPMARWHNKFVVTRLLRDGSLYYLAVCFAAAFTTAGSFQVKTPNIIIPALESNVVLAVNSLCASHLILSLHSLAADLGSDPKFILSNIEISRLQWRKGSSRNEIVVDVPPRGGEPVELVDIDPLSGMRSIGKLQTSRVGIWDRHDAELGFRSYTASSGTASVLSTWR